MPNTSPFNEGVVKRLSASWQSTHLWVPKQLACTQPVSNKATSLKRPLAALATFTCAAAGKVGYQWTDGLPSVVYWTKGPTAPGDMHIEMQLCARNVIVAAADARNYEDPAGTPYHLLLNWQVEDVTSGTLQLQLEGPWRYHAGPTGGGP